MAGWIDELAEQHDANVALGVATRGTSPWVAELSGHRVEEHNHEEDPIVPPANARILGPRIPDATVHVVPDAGHLLLMDPGRPLR